MSEVIRINSELKKLIDEFIDKYNHDMSVMKCDGLYASKFDKLLEDDYSGAIFEALIVANQQVGNLEYSDL